MTMLSRRFIEIYFYSLDTLTLDDAYRSRWDEEFDPLQVTPSG
jgi:hypothetical protein